MNQNQFKLLNLLAEKLRHDWYLLKKADEAFAQFDASGDDELDYKVEPGSLLTLISNSGK